MPEGNLAYLMTLLLDSFDSNNSFFLVVLQKMRGKP